MWRKRGFLAKRGPRYFVVPRTDVLCFVSDGGLTMLQTAKHQLWMQPSLGDLEERLDPGSFFRISRSAIVNLTRVQEIIPWFKGSHKLRLTTGAEVDLSRAQARVLRKILEW